MKNSIITLGLLALGLTFAEAGCGGGGCSISKPKPKKKSSYTPTKKTYAKTSSSTKKSSYSSKTHHDPAPINIGSEYQNPRNGFMKRLATAPGSSGFDYHGHINTSLVSLKQDSLMASRVSMLGKVEYGWGKSYLGYDAKNEIERTILTSRSKFSPNCLVVVFGFADKSGPADRNLRLSKTRADNVRKLIDNLNWSHNLHLKTATVAMGEKVELCRHNYGHNRVAEIWLVEFPVAPVATRVVNVVKELPAPNATIVTQPQIIERRVAQPLPTVSAAPVMPVKQLAPRAISVPGRALFPGNQLSTPPAVVTQTAPVTAQRSHVPVPLTQVPVQEPSTNQVALQGLIRFLQQNAVFGSESQQAEFARQLSALR